MKLTDLLDEFNVVIDTSEGLTELRSLILGLAVRGKLVPQDPNDEPASELLKKIEAEKERLYEEGEIRKPKKTVELEKNKNSVDLPEKWALTDFDSVLLLMKNGLNEKQNKDCGDYRVTRIETIADEFIDLERVGFVNDIKDSDIQKHSIEEGDILFSHINSEAHIGKTAIVEKDYHDLLHGVNLLLLRCDKKRLLPSYLNYYFKYLRFQELLIPISNRAINQSSINQKNLGAFYFFLPPLAEQHRIVQKIESLFAEVDELEAKLNRQSKLDEKLQLAVNAEVQQAPDAEASKTAWNFITTHFDTLYHTPEAIDNLKKNILNEAVRGRLVPQNPKDEPASELLKKIEAEKERLYDEGEIRKPKKLPPVKVGEIPFEIPESWEWTRFGTITNIIAGTSFKSSDFNSEGGVKAIKITNAGVNEFVETEDYLPKGFLEEYENYVVNEGDLILALTRPYISDGLKISKCPPSYDKSLLNQRVAAIKNICFENLDYFYSYLSTELVLNGYKSRFEGKGLQPNLRMRDITELEVPLPPIEEQHRIVRRIEELFAICDRFKAQLEQREKVSERLVKGLVQEVLENAGSIVKEAYPVEEVAMAAEPEEEYLTKQQIVFLQILCMAHALHVLKQRNMLQGEMGLAKYIYLVDRIGGVDTRFKFEQNNFGPYPSNFKRRLFTRSRYFYKAGEEGYEVIDLTNQSDRLFKKESEYSKQVQKSMESLANIFEPYQNNRAHKLELLASVCWLVEKTKKTDFHTIWKELENWRTPKRDDVDRKSELFTEKEVQESLKYILKNKWDKKLIKA